jgi:hypothetical protein
MAEREVVLDQPVLMDEQSEALRQATERAEHAEAELAKLKQGVSASHRDHPAATAKHVGSDQDGLPNDAPAEVVHVAGEDELRKDSMMAHLLDSLDAGKDIGHYGRLVFAMVARHFLPHDEVLAYLCKDRDFSADQANLMLKQVEGRDYNPPKRDRILEWQKEQDFPILPNPEDPDCGNLYRNLKFPEEIYDHIGHYQEQKLEAGE